jgi:hypothetical protein
MHHRTHHLISSRQLESLDGKRAVFDGLPVRAVMASCWVWKVEILVVDCIPT